MSQVEAAPLSQTKETPVVEAADSSVQGEGDRQSEVKSSQPLSQAVETQTSETTQTTPASQETAEEDLKRGASQLSQSSQEAPTKKVCGDESAEDADGEESQ